VNTKFRDSQKHFKLLQGARTIPYNIDAIRDTPECILVEGEFDALSYMAVGRTDVISVPNGANSQLDWLDELSESHFEQKQVIYLSVDTDRKGRELCRELSRRLGVDRCRIVTYGEAYKDANELLVAEGPDALLKALEDAPIPRLEGTFTAEDLRERLHQLFEEGYTSGVELGIPNLDEIMRLETGRVLTVTGIPGHGKSFLLNIKKFSYF
jgi:twinkle protein